jgi:hypothetical protein
MAVPARAQTILIVPNSGGEVPSSPLLLSPADVPQARRRTRAHSKGFCAAVKRRHASDNDEDVEYTVAQRGRQTCTPSFNYGKLDLGKSLAEIQQLKFPAVRDVQKPMARRPASARPMAIVAAASPSSCSSMERIIASRCLKPKGRELRSKSSLSRSDRCGRTLFSQTSASVEASFSQHRRRSPAPSAVASR